MARCDLRDVQANDYFLQVHRMATLNEDTTAAAFPRSGTTQIHGVIPQHVLTLGQNYVLIYLLLPTDQDCWLQSAMNRLKTERDETAEKSLLLLLWCAQTDAADQTTSAFAGDASQPSASRTYARELVHRKDKIGSKERTQASDSTEASLRQKRRERLKAVSDEALIDLDEASAKLIPCGALAIQEG